MRSTPSFTTRLSLALALLLLAYGAFVALLGRQVAAEQEQESFQRLSHGLARHIVSQWPEIASPNRDEAERTARGALLSMLEFGPAVRRAAEQNEPSIVTNLMIGIAGEIHSYLKDHHVLRAEPDVRHARLALVAAARSVLRTGLALIGVSAPDSM